MGQRLPPLKVLGLLVGFSGLIVVTLSDSPSGLLEGSNVALGNTLVLFSALAWAIYSIITAKRVTRNSPLVVTCAAYLFGAVFSVPLFFFADMNAVAWTSLSAWAAVIYLGMFASALTFFMWGFALANLEVSNASVVLFSIPVVSVLVGWLFLDEAVGTMVILGGVLVLGGIALVERSRVVAASLQRRAAQIDTDPGVEVVGKLG